MVKAVDEVDLDIRRGEVLGLVGESGCGKSVTSLSIMGLISHPGEIVAAKSCSTAERLASMKKEELRRCGASTSR